MENGSRRKEAPVVPTMRCIAFELIIYGLITLKILLKSTDLRRQFIKCKTNRLKINVFANFDVIEFWRKKI